MNLVRNLNDIAISHLSKKIVIVLLISICICALSCSSDDDSSGDNMPTTSELLTASVWYQESRSPGTLSDCEKNSSFKFNTDNTVTVESFSDNSGPCESEGILNATYTLNGLTITITLGTDVIIATINSISETELSVTDNQGETVVFDKTQG
ncbi:lipocalin family protein [Winogradskyella sp.]|uniref:lipocalin family protein n=1 Tax=Winogradskyella sp. TaxID=1883156 RepID=UPI003BAD9D4D